MRRPAALLAVALLAGAALLLRRGMLRALVRGDSMEPALHDGDRLLLVRTSRLRPAHPGEIVLARVPRVPGEWTIKRVSAVRAGGSVTLLGDNRDHSTDSRAFGDVPAAAVIAVAVYRYAPAERRGRLRAVGGPE